MRLESALGLTYRLHMKDDYDIEVAYLECGATKILSSSTNQRAVKIAWVHCDLAIKMADVLDSFIKKTRPYYQKYDHIVCVSQDVERSFVTLFRPSQGTEIVYNTVDDILIRQLAMLPLSVQIRKRKLTVVTLGRLTYQKGYDRLLRVHQRLLNVGVDYDLWILGEGPDRNSLEQYIKNNNLSGSVFLAGFQKNPYPWIREADVLVCSSRYEGFSTFITEGLLLGKPIVTTDCTGMRELLKNSESGMIVDNNEEALFCGLHQMLTDAPLRERYAACARIRGNEFTAKRLVAKTEEFFFSCVKE